MADAPDSVLARIQQLLNLASKNPSEHEAASAMAKATELMERYNLTHEAVSGAQVGSGARERAAVEGGYYQYERDLWQAVAELNFCLYWCNRRRNLDRVKNEKGHRSKFIYAHQLVGRRVNVAATRAMASYLFQAATRLTYERVRGDSDSYKFSNWANSYRRGVIERVCGNLRGRRSAAVRESEERSAAERRQADGASTSTSVALMTYIDAETDANLDFVNGEGYSARRASERAEAAATAARRQRGYTRWAAANPEEAAAQERARSRHARRRRSGGGRSDRNLDYGAYWSGYDDGASVSIDQQVDHGTGRRIGGG